MGCTRHSSSKLGSALVCTIFIIVNDINIKALTSKGKEIDFSQFQGKVLLIVNTASKCGFTPQFAGLEELNQKYKDKGLVIVGFPCNQFKEQDPEGDAKIEEFCQLNYGVTFQIMKKGDVNGPDAQPIFEYLKSVAPTEEYNGLKAKAAKTLFKAISKSVEKDSDIKWNFTKFLISKDGVRPSSALRPPQSPKTSRRTWKPCWLN